MKLLIDLMINFTFLIFNNFISINNFSILMIIFINLILIYD